MDAGFVRLHRNSSNCFHYSNPFTHAVIVHLSVVAAAPKRAPQGVIIVTYIVHGFFFQSFLSLLSILFAHRMVLVMMMVWCERVSHTTRVSAGGRGRFQLVRTVPGTSMVLSTVPGYRTCTVVRQAWCRFVCATNPDCLRSWSLSLAWPACARCCDGFERSSLSGVAL